jgi:hypothetical protein
MLYTNKQISLDILRGLGQLVKLGLLLLFLSARSAQIYTRSNTYQEESYIIHQQELLEHVR